MSRMLALIVLLSAPLAAQDLDIEALYEKWKAEESRTLEGWRVLTDDTLIEKLLAATTGWEKKEVPAKDLRTREAIALVGICYLHGAGGAPRDPNFARTYLEDADRLPLESGRYLQRMPHNAVRSADGLLEFSSPFWDDEGLGWPEDKFVPAQTLYALAWFNSWGRRDLTEGEKLLRITATAGCLPAMVFLARYQTEGNFLRRDANDAQAWLEKAAASHYTPAMMELAAFHHPYEGVRPNLQRCRELLLQASQQAEPQATRILKTLPARLLDELTVDELFAQFLEEWGEFKVHDSKSGARYLCASPSPVLARYPDVAGWLRRFCDPEKLDPKTATVATKAECMLGACIAHGIGGAKKDRAEAVSLLRHAADVGGWSAAALLFADLALVAGLREDVITYEDEWEALKYYQSAIDTGFTPALLFQALVSLDWNDYGYISRFGGEDAVTKFRLSEAPALAQLATLADKSDLTACRRLIRYYRSRSQDQLLKWTVKGANLRDPQAMFDLATFYADGALEPPKADSIRTLYQRCAESADDSQLQKLAIDRLGRLDLAPSVARAEALIAELEASLTKSAEFYGFLSDHPGIAGVAQRAFRANEDTAALYGLCLLTGHGISKSVVEATKVLLTAEDSLSASFLVAWMLEQKGDTVSLRSAVWTYEAVANVGGAYAAYRLGVIRSDKDSGYFSREKAYAWYLQAAEGGCLQAMVEVAKCYKEGRGVAADAAKAKEWAKKAADEGNLDAEALLKEWE